MSEFQQTFENNNQKIPSTNMKRGSFSSWRGNKYPQIKLRGFYSDIASNQNIDKTPIIENVPQVMHSHSWDVHKEKHVPLVHEFDLIDPNEFTIHLKNQIHGATTEIIKITDFTIDGYLPKCYIPFYTPPGELPRKVQIDRLKRLYLSMDISELLEEKNLQPHKLMPIHRPADEIILLNVLGQDPAPFPPFLPLHYFDDQDYEIWTPQEWLNKGIENKVYKPLPGKALLPNIPSNELNDPKDPKLIYIWQDVGVIDFDKNKNFWLVQKLSENERVLDENGNPVVNRGLRPDGFRKLRPNQYWVPRIQLQFLAEDPRNFANRVEAAFNERKRIEAFLRYQFYIDSMPNDDVIDLDQVSFRRMLDWTKNSCGLKTLPEKNREDTVSILEKEINTDFKRTMNKITFDKIVNENNETFKFVSVPPMIEKVAPEKGCISDIPEYDFDKQFYEFSFVSLLTKKESIEALSSVKVECNRVATMSLFQIPNKHMKLEEFEQSQNQQISQISLYLKDSWIKTLKNSIRSSFMDFGKGWFNIKETDWSVYQISKLKKFMELVKFCMQDSLRFLVQDSLVNYTQMVIDSCWQVVDIKETFQWPNEDLANSNIKPKKNALFLIELQIDKHGPRYNINYDNFTNVLCSVFEKSISSTQSVPQLEKYVMEDIFWSGTPLLESVGNLEPHIVELKETIIEAMKKAVIPLKAYATGYDKYTNLMNLNVEQYVKEFEKTEKTLDQVREEVKMHLREKEILDKLIPSSITIGPFQVVTSKIRESLTNKRKMLAEAILNYQTKKVRIKAEETNNSFRDIQRKLFEKPNNMEELHEHREWMKSIPGLLDDRKDDISSVLEEFGMLDEFLFNLSNEDFNMKWGILSWPWKISNMIIQVEEQHVEDEERFRKLQMQDTASLNDRLDTLIMNVAGLSTHSNMEKAHEVANECRRLNKALKECVDLSNLYNNRERLFGIPVTNYEKLARLTKDFDPYRNLWITTSDWLRWYDSWMNDPVTSIDAENIEKNVNDSYKSMHKAIKQFQEFENVQHVAVEIKNQIEEFKPNIPLIQALRNPGMRNRHWEMLSEELKQPIKPKKELTFKKCLEMGLDRHIDKISKVAEIAGKEYTIEQALVKMEGEWKPIKFDVLPYKNTGTYIIKASDEISQLLDDHIVMTQSMSFSPFKKAFEERISTWENKLKITQDVLDEWLVCQRSWLYLEPIFSSEDIIRQLPVESKRYQTMERIWRKIMKQAKENPEVISLCPDSRLRDQLRECNKLLEQVQKGLSEYLETKRTSFPRFYFLSDDELLEILSKTKDPEAVQPHLRKCFESIYKVKFESDMRISTMYSAENEEVQFRENIYPTGNVEDWMLEIERVMKESLRQIIRDSLEDYKTKPRTKWVIEWPGQVVIAGCQTYWTTLVSKALEEKKLPEYHTKQLKELDDLRQLVRGKLTSKARQTLSALIVIEVHARDVVINLLNEKVSDVNDFEWISQLRYYWMNDNLYIRAVNAEFLYGYEYLGNSSRLVITPLTDRCYLTLTGALHLKFGGAPAGPAGTGKTETTKDLAKAMAIQCVVFNCSDQLDFMAMGKFLKGLASAGAWACFDEFNRIDIEVLSVVAQQIQQIQQALTQRARGGADRFIFEGVEIALKQSCAVFITMNPGYAGRTELPDNLKALFRPVAMMVPDYALIAEISLFSFGFSDAKTLAKKIVTTFKLSSEQLSSQDHYDFGMRAVKSVISAAGNLKRQNPDMNEELICLRAIRDVNVPKFLQDDLKLFNGIVSDLFPKIKEEPIDYGSLESSLKKSCLKLDIKDVDNFILKCIQLYETTVVRHGLMLVGPTGSGKTKCYETLKLAMTALAGQPSPAGTPFEVVHTYILNPKSITMGQLYGEFDLLTHEWTDGILSCLMGQGVEADNDEKRWYIFDGPVDAVWIENMNTVLDDNKKLCLTNGEIIKMTDAMTMMFEVADLAVASPATVSRCGMVYLEPSILGLKPFVECWIRKLPENIFMYRDKLNKLFETFLEPAIKFIRKNCKEIIPTMDSNLTFSLLKLLDCFLAPYKQKEKTDKTRIVRSDKPLSEEAVQKLPELLEPWFLFSLIWSVGATCDNDGRIKFNEWLRKKMEKNTISLSIPSEGLVYDYMIDDGGLFSEEENKDDQEDESKKAKKTIQWKNWMTDLPELVLNNDTKFSDIIVPTIDNVRNSHLIEFLLKNDRTVLCVGPTGTGKTLTIADKLSRTMPKEYSPEFIVFSAKTSANQTQDLIDSKLDKRRKGIYGPPLGKYFVFFIDDLNMPALEVYGAQPPIELIRQWMDFKGWYDRKAVGDFRHLVDINFCCAMGPPGGGRNPVTLRLTRHFNHISFVEMEDSSMTKIFGTIFNWWIKNNEKISHVASNLIESCLSIYKTISAQLLPTPAKSHYTFNLRDLSKTFQGILMADAKSIDSVPNLVKLWYHESCRVFQDRLINDEDRNWFSNLLKEKMKHNFNLEYSDVVQAEPVIFADFMIPNADPKIYSEISDFKHMKKVIEEYLEEYNQINPAKMRLVLFLDAMRHIARISRIIRQPFGNALLLGVGGSGRQSLTRLAAHIAEYDCFQIELSKNYGMSEWRDDLKKVMLAAGLNNMQTVFLFSDTQIKNESFLEDLNNILNSGDVPNIYSLDELDQVYTAMKSIVQDAGLPPTKTNLFSSYTKRVRNNLHTVICMSPIGEIFRARLRQFPALVNCCTIDWFSEWPKDALESVAMTFLQEMADLEASDEIVNGLMNICQEMHQTVVVESIKYKEEQGRHNYVTPTSYLELLSIFSKIFGLKKNELIQARRRTKTGLDKLLSTEKEVTKLRADLEQMQPLLEEAVIEAKRTMETIEVDSKIASETRATVQKEEEEAGKKAKEAKAIADDAQRDLDEALPALEAALASLKSLNRNDVTEVKAMRNPPDGVKLVMEAVCIMKKVPPKKIAGDKPGTKVDDYTEPARNLLNDPGKFLEGLFTYDKENIPESVIKNIEPYINNDKFLPAAIAQVSKACTSICSWVRAMYKYYHVNKSVEPKREKQRIATEELAETQRTLANAKAKLKEVEEKLATLQAKYDDSVRKKAELEIKVKECEEKVIRAGKLVNGLGDEKVRWAENVKQLEFLISNVIGDVLAASGFIAYLGPFTAQYREYMTHRWIEHLKKYKVPHTESPEVVRTLGDPVKIRNWQLAGLPKDSLSVQNGIIVQFSQRWPLFIDPQGQANKWIKNLEKDNGIDVIKLSDRDFLRSLENAIRFGKPCLLENISTELDPALEPVLLRQTFKQSGNLVIKLGDAIIPYHEDFKFYITTKLPNPHYTPEVSVKVTLINFTLSPSGLEDQMLGVVVAEERPDLEEAKNQLIVSNSIMKNELKEIEDTILLRLSKSENPVDDIELINALEQSKIKSTEIKNKVVVSEQTEKDIDETRSEYVPVAINTQILFFCVSDLANIDPMYQYSLEWFTRIFLSSIQHANKADNLKERIQNINDHFTFNLYTNVCRSLFEKHKLLFAFLLTVRILMNQNKISMDEYRFFLAGGTNRPKSVPNPSPDWISERAWGEILTLESLNSFQTIVEDFKNHLQIYKKIFDSFDPHRESLPEPWATKLDSFQKIIFLKCLRPDKVTNAMQDFVAEIIGQRFIEPQTADLHLVFKDSSPSTPLIFVLSQGTDPAVDLYKFAEEMKFSKKLSAISLGQGQGPRAEAMARNAMERGLWVFFQNCHLAPSWMPSLERLVEQIDPEHVHKDFRLWLTSMPSPKFPVMILQNGSKMTVEPPRGIKANLLKSYTTINDDFFNSCTGKVDVFKYLLFALCLFHGVTLERRKFGPLGFNIPYEFTDGDLRICFSQLKMFLMEYAEIPYKVLKYTAGHINYGGRVTDDWDRRCIMNILEGFYNPIVVDENYAFDDSKVYHQLPLSSEHPAYMAYIKSLPINDTPEIFGLHDNANITFAQNETFRTLTDLLMLQPKTQSGGGVSREEIMEKTAKDILAKVPQPVNIASVMEKYPVLYEQSMNTVLVQEIIRYNKLLAVIHKTLQDLLKALKGLVVMSQELEEMSNSLFNNQVPNLWTKAAYPSLKPLAAWVTDLVLRTKFIQDWIDNGMPNVYWISGFFFPQAFLTGTLQNYARRNIISIDSISFGFEIIKQTEDKISGAPKDGCYIRGLYIEGARWDMGKNQLGESKPKELYSEVPIIWLIPSVNRAQPTSGIYVCPVYKTLTRAGTLSTTGHSTNFVFSVELPSDKSQTHWIKRGVAMLCALNY